MNRGLLVSLIVVAIFSLLPLIAGWGLTTRGQEARAQWKALANQLHATEEFRLVGAPAVAVWADYLPYAVVAGAAPRVADALAPKSGNQRLGLRRSISA